MARVRVLRAGEMDTVRIHFEASHAVLRPDGA